MVFASSALEISLANSIYGWFRLKLQTRRQGAEHGQQVEHRGGANTKHSTNGTSGGTPNLKGQEAITQNPRERDTVSHCLYKFRKSRSRCPCFALLTLIRSFKLLLATTIVR